MTEEESNTLRTATHQPLPTKRYPLSATLRQLHISTSKDNGGTDRYSVRIAAQMRERGDTVIYACRRGSFTEAQCRAQGIATRPLRVRNSGDVGAAIRIAALILRERTQIIHVHRRADFLMAALGVSIARPLFRLRNLPRPALILHSHVMRPLGDLRRPSGRFFRRTADAVLAVSQAGREFLIQRHTLTEDFVRLLLNGIRLADYATPNEARAQRWRRELRAEWGVPDDAFVIGMVGRLGQKGQETLLEIAPRLLALEPNLYLVFVGPETEPDAVRLHKERTGEDILGGIADYRERAAALGIADRVILTGARDDIPAVMSALDIFAHFPREEAFGLVLAEAMASGLPLVVSQVGGCAEVAEENVSALFVPPADANAAYRALASLLGSNGAPLRARLAASGPAIAARFSLDRQMTVLHGLYRELSGTQDVTPETVRDTPPINGG